MALSVNKILFSFTKRTFLFKRCIDTLLILSFSKTSAETFHFSLAGRKVENRKMNERYVICSDLSTIYLNVFLEIFPVPHFVDNKTQAGQ